MLSHLNVFITLLGTCLLFLMELSRPVWCLPMRDVKFITPHRSSNYFEVPFRKQNATHYFREFGWLPQPAKAGVQKDEFISRDDYEKALRAFQRFANLPETGVLDKATVQKMKEPRCGVKDVEDSMGGEEVTGDVGRFRRKRYTIEGSYWGVKDIRYRIREYTSNMDDVKVKEVIKKAFKVWEEQSPIRFIESDDDNVHINVMFAKRSHGDGEPFDGRGQILAHAFFPRYGGDVHFDEEEPWSAPGSRGIDLYSVAAHEIGHSLGLKHSDNHDALMAPFYQGYTGDAIHLHNDDIKGLQHLYAYNHKKCDCRFLKTYCEGRKCGCYISNMWCMTTMTELEMNQLTDVHYVHHSQSATMPTVPPEVPQYHVRSMFKPIYPTEGPRTPNPASYHNPRNVHRPNYNYQSVQDSNSEEIQGNTVHVLPHGYSQVRIRGYGRRRKKRSQRITQSNI